VGAAIEERTNEQWLADLSGEGPASAAAVEQLRDYLLRAILVYLTRQRSDLGRHDFDDLRQMAEDWAQAAVIQVIEKRDTFRGASKFTTWAYRVAINLAATDLRRKSWNHTSLEELVEERSAALAVALEQSATTPEQAATRRQIWADVQTAIDQDLSERQRLALTLAVVSGAPIEVVAETLETNRNNVYKIVHDARRKLRGALEARGWTADDVMQAFSAGSMNG
jgi:RNA polymerase sigma-70 factor (ECF subfamily)